jgi:hypothetical protein
MNAMTILTKKMNARLNIEEIRNRFMQDMGAQNESTVPQTSDAYRLPANPVSSPNPNEQPVN